MNKSQLIEKYQNRHTTLLTYYNNCKDSDETKSVLRSQLADILGIIEDLKNIEPSVINIGNMTGDITM